MFDFSEGKGRAVTDDAKEEAVALEAFDASFSFIGLDLDRLEGIRGVGRYLRHLSVLVSVGERVSKISKFRKFLVVVGIAMCPTVRAVDCRIPGRIIGGTSKLLQIASCPADHE